MLKRKCKEIDIAYVNRNQKVMYGSDTLRQNKKIFLFAIKIRFKLILFCFSFPLRALFPIINEYNEGVWNAVVCRLFN